MTASTVYKPAGTSSRESNLFHLQNSTLSLRDVLSCCHLIKLSINISTFFCWFCVLLSQPKCLRPCKKKNSLRSFLLLVSCVSPCPSVNYEKVQLIDLIMVFKHAQPYRTTDHITCNALAYDSTFFLLKITGFQLQEQPQIQTKVNTLIENLINWQRDDAIDTCALSVRNTKNINIWGMVLKAWKLYGVTRFARITRIIHWNVTFHVRKLENSPSFQLLKTVNNVLRFVHGLQQRKRSFLAFITIPLKAKFKQT